MIKFDVSEVEGLADKLASGGFVAAGKLVVEALNDAADEAYLLGRRTLLEGGVNLSDEYVRARMGVEHATDKKPQATITAFGGKAFMTGLSHYGSMQEDTEVNWTNAWILENIGRFRNWPGWTQRKGDQARGIEPNAKAHGVSVEVIKGRRKRIHSAIVIPGKNDTEGNPLVFRRHEGATKKVEHLQGPSVYQLFRTAIPKIEDDVGEDLQRRVIDAAERGWLEAL